MKNFPVHLAMTGARLGKRLSSLMQSRMAESQFEVGTSIERVLLLHESSSATVDYLVVPEIDRLGVEVIKARLDSVPDEGCLTAGTLVVIVRYLNLRWARFLDRKRTSVSQIVYFMDDDLFDRAARADLPAPFVQKLERLVDPFRSWLIANVSSFWVSSQFLLEKYKFLNVRLIDWCPAPIFLAQSEPVWVFYHGSGSHQMEQRWLRAIIQRVLEACPYIHFEIIGDISVNRLYRGLARTSILHPMSWPNYLAYTAGVRRHIGLAPLLPGPYNAARGPTKFFDFIRMGALGLYSDVEPYSSFITEPRQGVLLPNDPDAWCEAIVDMARALRNNAHPGISHQELVLGDESSMKKPSMDDGSHG